MKKLISIFLIVLCVVQFASAEVDLSSLTDEELIDLNHQIQMRLFSETLVNGVTIHPGRYIVGEDLPAGTYRAVAIMPEMDALFGTACVYNPGDLLVETSGSVTGKGYENIGKLVMEDGQIFEVTVYSVILYPYTGLFY